VDKITGLESRIITGSVRVFDDEQLATGAVLPDRISPRTALSGLKLISTEGWAGHARNAGRRLQS